MPTETLQDELYRLYDTAVSKTLMEIVKMSVAKKSIRLLDFNRKDKKHLFVLRVALMARDLYQFPIEIETSWWDWFIINRKIRKGFDKIKRAHIVDTAAATGVWVPYVIDSVGYDMEEETGIWVNLDAIYDAYYEGSCG